MACGNVYKPWLITSGVGSDFWFERVTLPLTLEVRVIIQAT